MVREGASLLGQLFISRRDAKAIYRPDHKNVWHWTSVPEKYTMGDFAEHLTGQHCLGTYLLAPDSTVSFLAFDLDLAKHSKYWKCYDIEQILALEEQQYGFDLDVAEGDLESSLHVPTAEPHRWARIVLLETVRLIERAVKKQWGMNSLTVITGGGAHVLVPFAEPQLAADARNAGIGLLKEIGARKRNDMFFDFGGLNELTIEVFPKQDTLDGKSLGNLIRLPFGWHHEAGIRTYSIDPEAATTPLWDFKKVSSLGALRVLAQSLGKK